jgi:hypothetical protein
MQEVCEWLFAIWIINLKLLQWRRVVSSWIISCINLKHFGFFGSLRRLSAWEDFVTLSRVLRSVFFWFTRHWWYLVTDVSGNLLVPSSRIQWMGCHKTLVTYYQSLLCNYPEESRSHLHHGGSLKLCIWSFLATIMCWKCHSVRCCLLFCCPVLRNLCNFNFFLHIVFNCGLLAVGLCLLSCAQTYKNTKKWTEHFGKLSHR